jgi:ribonuclease-3
MDLEDLQQKLGHRFRSALLLEEAVTHPSYGHEMRRRTADNQRLEFLGDAVLQLAATEMLYEKLPGASEGQLTPVRAQLVSRVHMQRVAEALGLGACLVLGKGEENNGGRTRGSNLADAMEAVIGAVYLDAGWDTARLLVRRLLDAAGGDAAEAANPKGALQEKLQAQGDMPPQYEVVCEDGPPHARQYEIRVLWQGKELGRGRGLSKKEAETQAARAALESL